MDGCQSEADEGRDEPRGHVHVALVGDGQDDDKEAGGGEGLVHNQRGRGRARVGERGEDAGALHVLAQRGGGVADAVGVDTVEHGRAQQGAEVLGEPVDGDLQSIFGFGKSLRFRIDNQDLKKEMHAYQSCYCTWNVNIHYLAHLSLEDFDSELVSFDKYLYKYEMKNTELMIKRPLILLRKYY